MKNTICGAFKLLPEVGKSLFSLSVSLVDLKHFSFRFSKLKVSLLCLSEFYHQLLNKRLRRKEFYCRKRRENGIPKAKKVKLIRK